MTTKCETCGHEFTNLLLRRRCPQCQGPLKRDTSLGLAASPASSSPSQDDGFDTTGFAIGMMTGIPLSPTRGFSTGALLGAALHSEPSHAHPSPPADPTPAPSIDTSSSYSSSPSSSSSDSSSSSSSSYDSGSSSSSYDSRSSSSSSSDSGGSW